MKKSIFIKVMIYFFALAFLSQVVFSQEKTKGIIRGMVSDGETGEVVIGANISVEGTTRGAATDLDGKYSITLPIGTYSLFVSALGYEKKRITEVNVEPGTELRLFLVLQTSAIKADEVVVEAKANTSYEATALTKQKKAAAISDGLSAEQIKRAPDATTGEAIRRMTGITLVDNKFVFIRGTTERYNQTTLNGTIVSSTDPDRKSFSYDMIPSNLIDNTVITKSATPDLRGDFAGGIVQLTTLDFPDKFQFKAGFGTSSNTVTTGKEFIGQQEGRLDWLGIDDGTRNHELPPYNNGDLVSFLKSLPNTWGTRKYSAPLPATFFVSMGDAVTLSSLDDGFKIGYIGSLSYRNSYQHNDFFRSAEINSIAKDFKGPIDNYSVLWAGLANLSFRFNPLHTISLKNNYTHSADQEVKELYSDENLSGFIQDAIYNISKWTQRSIYSGQITGEHQFTTFGNIHLEWHVAVSTGERQVPDFKEMSYNRVKPSDPSDPAQLIYTTGNARRSWSTLHDRNTSYSADLMVPLSILKFKTGVLVEKKKTDFSIRTFTITPDFMYMSNRDILSLPLDLIYAPENIGGSGDGLFMPEYNKESTKPTDAYWGNSTLSAGYFMVDIPFNLFAQNFRLIGGWRIENYSLDLSYTNNPSDPLSGKTTTLKHNVDYLPSLNFTYQMSEISNLRFAFSKTLNRPEFREISSTDFYDFELGIYEIGNPGLERATIFNYDVRYELFPSSGELAAVSYFKKEMRDVTEVAMYFYTNPTRTWIKSPHAECEGYEFELRKNFGFINPYLSNLSVSANYSRIYSSVVYRVVEYDNVFRERPLQGQSPYVINAVLAFTEPSLGTSISILYNRFGERVDAVGSIYDNRILLNIYEQPRDMLDLSVTQVFSWSLEAKLTIKNLNGKDRILLIDSDISSDIDSYNIQKIQYERRHTGTSIGFQLTKTL